MRPVCLIPSIRPETAEQAADSARSDGWDVLIEPDPDRSGPCATRNRLFARAVDAGYDLIRYADDDDLVLPHLAQVLPLFEAGADIVYHDWMHVTPNGLRRPVKMLPDPIKTLAFPPDAWGWIGKVDALKRILADGELWPKGDFMEGPFLYLRMVKAGLKIRHAPVQAYEYRMGSEGCHSKMDSALLARYRSLIKPMLR